MFTLIFCYYFCPHLSVLYCVQLARDGTVPAEQVRAYLEYSKVLRAFLEKYFNLRTTLYFQSTQIVCQSADTGLCSGSISYYQTMLFIY